MREDGNLVTKRVSEGLPDPLHTLVVHANGLILVVNTGKEPGIKAHFSEETRVGVRMAKGVNVPADARGGVVSELAQEELMADHHVIHHIVVVSASLIVHGPAGIDELETALFDELTNVVLLLLSLLFPPHREELHLDLSEALVFVSHELDHVRIDNVSNVSDLDILRRTGKVFINSFEPADIVVTVWHDVHIQVVVALTELLLKRV